MILVTGARGKTGREVTRLLHEAGAKVLAGSSQPGAGTRFAWDDPATWAHDADAVYLVRPDVPDAPALAAGVVERNPRAHVVLLSEQGAGELPAGHWARRVEEAVSARASSWTVLRPSWFHQVLTDDRFYRGDLRARRTLALSSGGGPIAWVDARDIAAVAVAALRSPAGHRGLAHTVTGPAALTVREVADALTAAVGGPVHAEDPPPPHIEGDPFLTEILSDLYERVRDGGFAEVSPTVEQVTGRAPTAIGGFIAENVAAWRSTSFSP